MDIKIKDRDLYVEYFRIACNIIDIEMDYVHADLIIKLLKKLNEKKGSLTISDALDIKNECLTYWKKYLENNKL